LAKNAPAEAEQWLKSGIAIADQQGALSFALRGAISLAALWGGQGKREEAHHLLGPIYGRFTEGFDTLDLQEAKALLDELA
jgi:predicted ATPase